MTPPSVATILLTDVGMKVDRAQACIGHAASNTDRSQCIFRLTASGRRISRVAVYGRSVAFDSISAQIARRGGAERTCPLFGRRMAPRWRPRYASSE
jgi:hypothetical protein